MNPVRPILLAMAFLLAAPAFAQEEGDSAPAKAPERQKRGDELEDRIPAVSGHLFLKKGRHEISPVFDLTLSDAFRQKFIGGLGYTYHLSDHVAVAGRFGYTLASLGSGTVQVCPRPSECRPPTDDELDALPGNVSLLGGVLGEWSPLYGKLNIIAEQVLHFDIYVTAGLGAAGYTLTKAGADAGGISPALMLGVGQRFFVSEWFALRLELLDVIYDQPTAKLDGQLHNQLMFTVGASFFFPTTFSY